MKDRFGFDASGLARTRFWRRPELGRRAFFRHLGTGTAGYFLYPGLTGERLRAAGAATKGTAKYCIFVLMRGGPSQIDTFDLKEGAWTPRELAPESFGGIRWPRGLMPQLANHLDSVALLRSVEAWAAVHVLAQVWVQIGRSPLAAASKFAPHIGSVVAMEYGARDAERVLPAFLSMNAGSGIGAGFLPPENAPLFVTPGGAGMANTSHRDGPARYDRRFGLLLDLDAELRGAESIGGVGPLTASYSWGARKLVYNDVVDRVFSFPNEDRVRYGNSQFGNACIAARNMLKHRTGVRFIQIQTLDWDQHENIWTPDAGHFARAKEFDSAMGPLIADLKAEGLFEETLIVCMGEFGRTVGNLNASRGRDHFLQQSVLMAGAGIAGGRTIGETNAAGTGTLNPGWSRDRDIRAEDVEATIYSAMGIDWTTVRQGDPTGRGFYYVPDSDRDVYAPVHELWG